MWLANARDELILRRSAARIGMLVRTTAVMYSIAA
jgi:hypothetical protein